jgi:cation diffusion facilitator family transporter
MQEQTTLRTQKIVVVVAIALFGLKLAAYLFTHSVAVLTDALESTVNIIAAFIGLYSIYLASLPRDKNHPYGHGKVEFLSAAIEGALIVFAGLVIVYKSIEQLLHPEALHSLDIGMILIGITALVNYGVGTYCVKKGEKEKSIALVASGKHLLTDTYYTLRRYWGFGRHLLYALDMVRCLGILNFCLHHDLHGL